MRPIPRTNETVTVEPRKVILVEGILIFENRALCDQMDIKIFVDTDADVRLIRRIRRDVAKSAAASIPCSASTLQRSSPCSRVRGAEQKNADLVVLGAARIWSRSR